MKLTKYQAKDFSIKKWNYIVSHGTTEGLIMKYPELIKLRAYCGYCEKYECCEECPINCNLLSGCMDSEHPYAVWHKHRTKENVQRVLNLILDS